MSEFILMIFEINIVIHTLFIVKCRFDFHQFVVNVIFLLHIVVDSKQKIMLIKRDYHVTPMQCLLIKKIKIIFFKNRQYTEQHFSGIKI